MCVTRRQGNWKRWPRVNIIAIKLKTEFEMLNDGAKGSNSSSNFGWVNGASRLPKNASIFDVAPLVRYFQLCGSMPGELRP
jgi:hypothetical protein